MTQLRSLMVSLAAEVGACSALIRAGTPDNARMQRLKATLKAHGLEIVRGHRDGDGTCHAVIQPQGLFTDAEALLLTTPEQGGVQ